jgi:hypothetical protein
MVRRAFLRPSTTSRIHGDPGHQELDDLALGGFVIRLFDLCQLISTPVEQDLCVGNLRFEDLGKTFLRFDIGEI